MPLSAPLKRLTTGVALAMVAVVGACQSSEAPEPPPRANPFQTARPTLEAWAPWFEQLRQLDPDDFCGEALCLRWSSQRLMWDEALSETLADVSILEDAEQQAGPLLAIVDFARQLETLGVDLLVVVVPPASAVYPELVSDSAPLKASETPPLLDGRLRDFYAALAEAEVEVLDLLPTFLERRYGAPIPGAPPPGREMLYQWQDPHWTPRGAAVTAELVAARVQRYPWFAAVAASQGEAQWVESSTWIERHGSIALRLIRDGKAQSDLPRDRWRQHTVRITGERWSFNDRQSPLVLLGDSFSGPAYGFADQLLKNLGFRVDSVVVAGGLPTAGLKALRFRGDKLAGKRLVIWEMTAYSLQVQERWRPVDVMGDG